MNLIKKPNTNSIVIFIEDIDFKNRKETIFEQLKEIIPIVVGSEISIKLQDVNDIPMSHFGILLSFFKIMKEQKARLTIKCGKELLACLLDIGIGNLVYSVEEI